MKFNLLRTSLVIMILCTGTMIVSAQVSTLNGVVSYHNDGIRVLPNVNVMLYDDAGELVETSLTDQNGYYEFVDLPYGTYTLTGSTSLNPGGVSVASAFQILKHLSGQQPLNTMQQLAADVNGDDVITGHDFATILVDYLVHGNPFPAGEWVFETITVELVGTKSGGSGGNGSGGLGGSSTGDTGGVFEPEILNQPIASLIDFTHELSHAKAGQEVVVMVKAADILNLAGMHLVLEYPSHLIEIINVESDFGFFEYTLRNNEIVLSAADLDAKLRFFSNGSYLLKICARTTEELNEHETIVFKPGSGSHFVGSDFEKTSAKISLPCISGSTAKTELVANFPNPFSLQTTINYTIASLSHVNLSVYDLNGRLIRTLINEQLTPGSYQNDFNKESLPSGAYFLRLTASGNNPVEDTRVMIITSD
jgi:hypothetical protein